MVEKRKIIIAETAEALAVEGGRLLVEVAETAVAERGRCMVALSGGNTPRKMHALLGQEPYASQISWNKIHLFWGDERCVPAESQWSNYGRAKEDLLDSIDIPAKNLHPMPGDVPPEEEAVRYEKEIPEVFDLIFLGLGADGHTASLFPGHGALEERRKTVVPVRDGTPDVPRLTVTFGVINRARNVVFLVSGKEKAPVVKSILQDHDIRLPAARVAPSGGTLTWVMDREAASLLSKEITGGPERQ